MPEVEYDLLKLSECCVSFGFSALKTRICLIDYMWAGKQDHHEETRYCIIWVEGCIFRKNPVKML